MTMHTPFRRVPEFGPFPAPRSNPTPSRISGEADADFRLRMLASQINVLDVLRYQAGISRGAIDIGPAAEYSQEDRPDPAGLQTEPISRTPRCCRVACRSAPPPQAATPSRTSSQVPSSTFCGPVQRFCRPAQRS